MNQEQMLYLAFAMLGVAGALMMRRALTKALQTAEVWEVRKMDRDGLWQVVDVVGSYAEGVTRVQALRLDDAGLELYSVVRV